MKFSVIYQDDRVNQDARSNIPDSLEDKLDETEGDDCFEYGYLDFIDEDDELSHTKQVGVLSKEELRKLLRRTGLYIQEETAGAIGAPGFGPYHVPAIAVVTDDLRGGEINRSLWVTPMPEINKDSLTGRDFERIKKAFKSTFDLC